MRNVKYNWKKWNFLDTRLVVRGEWSSEQKSFSLDHRVTRSQTGCMLAEHVPNPVPTLLAVPRRVPSDPWCPVKVSTGGPDGENSRSSGTRVINNRRVVAASNYASCICHRATGTVTFSLLSPINIVAAITASCRPIITGRSFRYPGKTRIPRFARFSNERGNDWQIRRVASAFEFPRLEGDGIFVAVGRAGVTAGVIFGDVNAR